MSSGRIKPPASGPSDKSRHSPALPSFRLIDIRFSPAIPVGCGAKKRRSWTHGGSSGVVSWKRLKGRDDSGGRRAAGTGNREERNRRKRLVLPLRRRSRNRYRACEEKKRDEESQQEARCNRSDRYHQDGGERQESNQFTREGHWLDSIVIHAKSWRRPIRLRFG